MKNIKLVFFVVIMACMVVGCSNKNTNSEISGNNNITSSDNQSNDVKDAGSESVETETENVADDMQTPEETDEKIEEKSDDDKSVYDFLSGVHESSTITIGDINFTYPLSWDAMKEILDANNVDYKDLAHDLELSTELSGNAYLDSEGNSFALYLKKVGDEVIVTQIVVNIAKEIDQEKYPVKFDGKITSNSDINDVIKLYGNPDLTVEEKPKTVYRWKTSDKRKIQITVTTGLGLGVDPNQISQIAFVADE